MKNKLKKIYYKVLPERLPAITLHLAYIFHTESLFNEQHYTQMLSFVKAYRKLTGKRALATLMSGANPRVREGAKNANCEEKTLAERMLSLQEDCEIGFHGHYALGAENYPLFHAQIKGFVYDISAIKAQMEAELEWFTKHEIPLGPYYSAGWWFQSIELYRLLAEKKFQLDASVSYSPWFRQNNTYPWFKAAGILPAEAVRIESKVLAVQNLIGCHNTPFPDDFLRHVRSLLNRAPAESHAFVHSHDFDLIPAYSLATLERLQKEGVIFAEANDFLSIKTKNLSWVS